MIQRVLLVDDEPNVLNGFKRHLRKNYDLQLAVGGQAALDAIQQDGPFAVVVSDMQMPEMSGVELLSKIQQSDPQTVRVMLTGNADQKTAVDAVNEGNIFRFLNKPCPPERLAKVLDAALEQYRLVTAEAELLNSTLSGSVLVLTQVLSLVLPEVFGLSHEARRWAGALANRLKVEPTWEVEMAAMLMRLGCVSLPKESLDQYLSGKPLDTDCEAQVAKTPEMGHSLLAAIPRLNNVADFIRSQNDPPKDTTPIASRIIRVIGDYQRYFHADASSALDRLQDPAKYDPEIVSLFSEAIVEAGGCQDVDLDSLDQGMILAGDVLDKSGRLLIAGGLEVHQAMINKLTMFRESGTGVQEPIKVRTSGDSLEADAVAAAAEFSEKMLAKG